MEKALLFIILAVVVIGGGYWVMENRQSTEQRTQVATTTKTEQIINEKDKTTMETQTSFQIIDLTVGTGEAVKSGDTVSVQYRGTLEDGTVFDESYKRGEAFTFTVGVGQVIQGWDQGLIGMKIGGKRKLIIPYTMGYGEQGMGPIPPKATLLFEIELEKISK